jgi:hypothetical protein
LLALAYSLFIKKAIGGEDRFALKMARFYVYVYRNPDSNLPVYVGKGTGVRAWSHLKKSSNSQLDELIQSFCKKEVPVLPEIVFKTSDEFEALAHEAALIVKYGRLDKNTGTLFNRNNGNSGRIPSLRLTSRISEILDQMKRSRPLDRGWIKRAEEELKKWKIANPDWNEKSLEELERQRKEAESKKYRGSRGCRGGRRRAKK